MEVQSSDFSLSKILRDNMLQEGISLINFKIDRCSAIYIKILKLNIITVLSYLNTRKKSVILYESESQNWMQDLKTFSWKQLQHSQTVAKDQQNQQFALISHYKPMLFSVLKRNSEL